MLKKILLNNYTTFISETIFDFEKTNYKFLEDINVASNKILKGGLFMGDNASGKTKALNSIKILLDFLFSNEEFEYIKNSSLYSEKENYILGYEFIINNQYIYYEIELCHSSIVKEKLLIDGAAILTREESNGALNFNNQTKTYENLNSNLLLLRSVYFNTRFDNDKLMNDWFSFMNNSIYIDCYSAETKIYNVKSQTQIFIKKYLEQYGPDKLNDFLNKINYDSTIKYSSEIVNSDVIIGSQNGEKDIFLTKNNTKIDIPLEVESVGNQVLIQLILPFLYASENNCMILIDEFSSGLHNELEEALVKYFFTHSKDSQMFIVSHSTNLLKTSIFRPDQIYSFHFNNGTVVKRFSDESPREGQNLEKMYLSGVFDGLPEYNKFI